MTVRFSHHALTRLSRLTECGLTGTEVNALAQSIVDRAGRPDVDHDGGTAVQVYDLGLTYKCADGSTGNAVFVIFKGGVVVTVMLCDRQRASRHFKAVTRVLRLPRP